jgi:2-phospho-L-lactate guanylyltransferase (CobY/MobA/RfbA family)
MEITMKVESTNNILEEEKLQLSRCVIDKAYQLNENPNLNIIIYKNDIAVLNNEIIKQLISHFKHDVFMYQDLYIAKDEAESFLDKNKNSIKNSQDVKSKEIQTILDTMYKKLMEIQKQISRLSQKLSNTTKNSLEKTMDQIYALDAQYISVEKKIQEILSRKNFS